MAVELDISAFKRVPFQDADGCTFAILGPDYTGSSFLMHIRNKKGDIGAPIVSLANAPFGSEGISVTYEPSYIYNEEGSTAPASKLMIQINEPTLEALALNNPSNAPVVLYYDLHITPVGQPKRVEMFGRFVIEPGATI